MAKAADANEVEVRLIPLRKHTEGGMVTFMGRARIENKLDSSILNVKAIPLPSDGLSVTPAELNVFEVPAHGSVLCSHEVTMVFKMPTQDGKILSPNISWQLSYTWSMNTSENMPKAMLGAPRLEKNSVIAPQTAADIIKNYKTLTPTQLIELWASCQAAPKAIIEDLLFEQMPDSLISLRSSVNGNVPGDTKLFALRLLSDVNDKQAEVALIAALSDSDKRVQVRAVQCLSKMRSSSALQEVRQRIVSDAIELPMRKACLAALGRIGNIEDCPILHLNLNYPDLSVQVNAAASLAMLGDYSAENLLLQTTYSNDSLVQKEAIYALGFLSTTKSASRLTEIVDQPSVSWQSYARIALAQQSIAKAAHEERLGILKTHVFGSDSRVSEWALAQIAAVQDKPSIQCLKEIENSSSILSKKACNILRIIEVQQ